jgi:hypothetical protein
MLTSSTAIILVDLLKMLSRNPPIYIVTKIQELLILLHHPSESFVTHDRSKFNFNLSSQKPLKSNKNTAISSKFYFNFSTKIRSTNTSSLPASPSSSNRSSVSNSPKSPKLLTTEEMKIFFNEDSEFNCDILAIIKLFYFHRSLKVFQRINRQRSFVNKTKS